MKKTKKISMIVLVAMAAILAVMVLVGCGGKTYSTRVEFDEDNTAANSGLKFVADMSVVAAETTLEINGSNYVLTKTSYAADNADYNADTDKWYAQWHMVLQLVFEGTCSQEGDDVTLEVPTSATKLVYYHNIDYHTVYPSRFQMAMTTPDDDGVGSTDPVVMTATDADMKYFGGLYISTDSTAVKQIYTVSDKTITEVKSA